MCLGQNRLALMSDLDSQDLVSEQGMVKHLRGDGLMQITRNFGFLLLARFGQFFVRSIFMILVARHVGATEFGRYAFATSFAVVASIVADMGLSYSIIPQIAREPEGVAKHIAEILPIRLVLSVISLAFVFLFPIILAYPSQTKLLIWLIGTAVVVDSMIVFLFAAFRGLERMQYEAGVATAQNIGFCLVAALLLLGGRGVEGVALARLIVDGLALIVMAALYRKHIGRLYLRLQKLHYIRQTVVRSSPFALQVVLATIYFEIGTLLLGTLVNEVAVGYYQAAMRVVVALVIVADVISNAYYPRLSQLYAGSREALEYRASQLVRWLAILGAPLSVFFFVLARQIVGFLYKDQYGPSVPVMRIVAWVIVLRFVAYGLGTLLTSTNRQPRRVVVIAISAVVSAATGLFLVNSLQAVGAAIAITLAHVVLLVGYYWAADLRLQRGEILFWAKLVLISLGLGALIYVQRDLPLLLLAVEAGAVYCITGFFWLLTPEDRTEFNLAWLRLLNIIQRQVPVR